MTVRWYLVQAPSGVPQEGDGVSRPHADRHGSEAGRRAVQYGLGFHGDPAGHGAGGVVGAAGVGIQRVLAAGDTGGNRYHISRFGAKSRLDRLK